MFLFGAKSLLLSCVSSALVLFCAVSAQAADAQRHVLWSLKGEHNIVYLLGSVHFLSPQEPWPAAMDAAYAEAEALLMEIDLDDLDPLAIQQAMLELAVLPPDKTLESEIGKQAFSEVEKSARAAGVDAQILNRYRPWFAALTLMQANLRNMGLDPAAGVEQRLATRAAADRKPLEGLETMPQQLQMLANLPAQQQREFLLYSVEDVQRARQEVNAMLDAWRRGDIDALARLLSEGFEQYPALYRPLTVERNRQWTPIIESLLDDRQDYLVVVGALHLVGQDSVIELLERKGHKVTQH